MKNNIKSIFPTEFYAKDDYNLYAEVSIQDLNKILYYINNKEQRIDKAIELIKRSAGYKGICTQPETDTFSKLLEILEGKNEKD